MYFEGFDTAGHVGLWVSDGIAADTHEIVPANAFSGGIFSNAFPYFTVYNGSLYFAGRDASNHTVLWTSGGTAATTNVVPVPGLEQPFGLVSFNRSLYFDGIDPSGHFNLWQSDGTAAGTHELIVADASSSFGLVPRDLTPYASPTLGTTGLYFNGLNADVRQVLFATDETAAGTHEITGIAGASVALNPSDITVYNG